MVREFRWRGKALATRDPLGGVEVAMDAGDPARDDRAMTHRRAPSLASRAGARSLGVVLGLVVAGPAAAQGGADAGGAGVRTDTASAAVGALDPALDRRAAWVRSRSAWDPAVDEVWAQLLASSSTASVASAAWARGPRDAASTRAPGPLAIDGSIAPLVGPDPRHAGLTFGFELAGIAAGPVASQRFERGEVGRLTGLAAARLVVGWSSFVELFGELQYGGSELSPSGWSAQVAAADRPTSGEGTSFGGAFGLRLVALRLDPVELYAQAGALFVEESYSFRRSADDGIAFASIQQNAVGPFAGLGARLTLGRGWSAFFELDYASQRQALDVTLVEGGVRAIGDAVLDPLAPGPTSARLSGVFGVAFRFDAGPTRPASPGSTDVGYGYAYGVGPWWPYRYPWMVPVLVPAVGGAARPPRPGTGTPPPPARPGAPSGVPRRVRIK